jgi:hypothetical protein
MVLRCACSQHHHLRHPSPDGEFWPINRFVDPAFGVRRKTMDALYGVQAILVNDVCQIPERPGRTRTPNTHRWRVAKNYLSGNVIKNQ